MKIKKFDSINVIPFIDIMLVLLVIVLTTATFIAKGSIPLDLPKGESSKSLPIKKIEISITKDGKIFYNNKEVSLEKLKNLLKNVNKKDNILIRTDKNSKFEYFVSVIDILKAKGIDNISIVTVK
ncbi:TonB system transport protein ExbD [Nitrosophilus kaiyonis]|uniref:TonB system transport protein ExbD n=1 Tax=Nitrosophilus kaiyonis TaxID=2930200 RepID=UPI002491D91F|nr:TonB system transport protein ExbD [Nitrosophilus kaiyonis]